MILGDMIFDLLYGILHEMIYITTTTTPPTQTGTPVERKQGSVNLHNLQRLS